MCLHTISKLVLILDLTLNLYWSCFLSLTKITIHVKNFLSVALLEGPISKNVNLGP